MADTGAAIAALPDLQPVPGQRPVRLRSAPTRAGALLSLATDVGAGTSFSMLQTMNEAYKVARLKGSYLPALRMFYLATLGAARSMQLEGTIGNFAPGAEADFIVLDPEATPLLARRTGEQRQPGRNCCSRWPCWATTAPSRATYSGGRLQWARPASA